MSEIQIGLREGVITEIADILGFEYRIINAYNSGLHDVEGTDIIAITLVGSDFFYNGLDTKSYYKYRKTIGRV